MQANYDYLRSVIASAINQLVTETIQVDQIELTVPSYPQFGDYSTNIGLKFRKLRLIKHYQSPGEFAKELINNIHQFDVEQRIDNCQIGGNGFINIYLTIRAIIQTTNAILLTESEKNARILVEFVGPNTNKQLHIGHLLNAVLGHSVINSMREVGYNVDSGTIYNDRGIHIIKSMYSYLRMAYKEYLHLEDGQLVSIPTNEVSYQELLDKWQTSPEDWLSPDQLLVKSDHFVGWCYAKGNELAELDENVQSEMQAMLQAWEAGDSQVRKLWQKTNGWFYQGLEKTLDSLGIYASRDGQKFFDKAWYESEIYQHGKDIIIANLGKGVIQEFPDGHVEAVLEEQFHLPNLVLLRKDKTALYATQDIELLRSRLKDDKYSQVIYVVDYRQTLQFKQLFTILESLKIPEAANCLHLAYGEVRTPQGAMSSRKGNIISADQLIEETTSRALDRINSPNNTYTFEEKQKIAHHVALAAIKYGLLKQNPTSNIIFDIEKSISFEGDTGPYLLYTYARCHNIILKSGGYNYHSSDILAGWPLASEKEQNLIRYLERVPLIIAISVRTHSPNNICEYLYTLAQQYNAFYTESPVNSENNIEIRKMRLAITSKTMQTLSRLSKILGIEMLERM